MSICRPHTLTNDPPSSCRDHPLHPIFHLPNELIGEVFQCCTFQDPESALTISHVSQYFRNAALSIPTLWTQIVFKEKPVLDKAKVFLQRSRSADLDVRIRWSTMANLKVLQAEEAIEILLPHMSRVARLEFWSWNHTVLQYLLRGIRGSAAEKLKTLLIHVTERQAFVYDAAHCTKLFCASSVQLETLSIGVSAFNLIRPPLGQIKSIILKEDEGGSVRTLLSALQTILGYSNNLQRLAIVAVRRPVASWQQLEGSRVASKVLTTLRLTDCPLTAIKYVLRSASPSSIKHLTIENSRLMRLLTPNAFSQLPSLPELTTLELRAVCFSAKDLLQALKGMEKLYQFHLECCSLEEELIEGLDRICPLLHDLALVSNIPYDQIQGHTPWKSLQKMIQRRGENLQTTSIRRLKVREQFGQYEHIEAIENLRKMVPELVVV